MMYPNISFINAVYPFIQIVVWLFLTVPWVCLQFVIVVFPHHTHLLFWAPYFPALNYKYDHIPLFADNTTVYVTLQGQEDVAILQDDLNVLQE